MYVRTYSVTPYEDITICTRIAQIHFSTALIAAGHAQPPSHHHHCQGYRIESIRCHWPLRLFTLPLNFEKTVHVPGTSISSDKSTHATAAHPAVKLTIEMTHRGYEQMLRCENVLDDALTLDRGFCYCGGSNVTNRHHVARTSLTDSARCIRGQIVLIREQETGRLLSIITQVERSA